MNWVETILAHPLVTNLGWALIHFIWQGTLVALLLASVLAMLQRRSANARYTAACSAMLLMLVLPPATMTIISLSSPDRRASRAPAQFAAQSESQPMLVGNEPASDPTRTAISTTTPLSEASSWSASLRPLLPWLIMVWLSGVVFFSLRLIYGWLSTQRLRHNGIRQLDEEWLQVLRRLGRQLRVIHPVRLLESTLVDVPTAIGWLRPVILLPAGALTGLTPQQLEAIIAHELAHIRRHDYLINLLQAVIETLLFYHPAVWWVSRRIRQEREHCCDDLAVAVCGDALTYARALIEMEQLRIDKPQLAIAANGGMLMNRIDRLVGVQKQYTNRPNGLFAGIFVITLVISIGLTAKILLPSPRVSGAVGTGTDPQVVSVGKQEAERLSANAQAPARPNLAERAIRGLIPHSAQPGRFTEALIPVLQDQSSTTEQITSHQSTAAESIKALNSSNPAERAAAACSLGKLGAVEAIPALTNLLGDDTPIESARCWGGGEWNPALHTFKQASPGEQAAIALASMSQPALEPLIAALDNANSSVRRNAAWAIGEIRGGLRTDRSSAVEPLIIALSDADGWVRTAAAFSLGEMRPRPATEALIATLKDTNWKVREMAARALGEMKARHGVEGLTAALLRDGDERVRRKAAWALGEIRDPLALDALAAALNDQDLRVRATAKWAISEIQD